MDSKTNGSDMRKIRGRRHTYTGVASGFGGEQSRGETECYAGNGESSGGRSGSGEVASAVPQKESHPLVTDDTVIRSKVIHGDGGSIEEYEGGGKRGVVAERYDLVPPIGIQQVAVAMAEGAARYGDLNWHGLPISNCTNHALKHIYQWIDGNRDEDHLGHAAANLLMAAELEKRDDRYSGNGIAR